MTLRRQQYSVIVIMVNEQSHFEEMAPADSPFIDHARFVPMVHIHAVNFQFGRGCL